MFTWIIKIAEIKLKVLDFFSPLANLAIRLWMAEIFWKAGVSRLPDGFLGIGKGHWGSTLHIFLREHSTPYLSTEPTAIIATAIELICPILLILGFGTRIAALLLFGLIAFYHYPFGINIEQIYLYQMAFLTILILQGAGKISLDYVVRKNVLPEKKESK